MLLAKSVGSGTIELPVRTGLVYIWNQILLVKSLRKDRYARSGGGMLEVGGFKRQGCFTWQLKRIERSHKGGGQSGQRRW